MYRTVLNWRENIESEVNPSQQQTLADSEIMHNALVLTLLRFVGMIRIKDGITRKNMH